MLAPGSHAMATAKMSMANSSVVKRSTTTLWPMAQKPRCAQPTAGACCAPASAHELVGKEPIVGLKRVLGIEQLGGKADLLRILQLHRGHSDVPGMRLLGHLPSGAEQLCVHPREALLQDFEHLLRPLLDHLAGGGV